MQSFRQYLTEAKIDFAPWHETDPEKVKLDTLKRYLKRFGWKDENFDTQQGKNRIEDTLAKDFKAWSFNKNGTVTFRASEQALVNADLIDYEGGRVIPFQIQNATRFVVSANELISAWGCPLKANEVRIKSLVLETLEHLTTTLSGTLYLQTPSLKEFNCKVKARGLYFMAPVNSLSGIHKSFELGHYIGFDTAKSAEMVKENMLGVLLIPGELNTLNVGHGQSSLDTPFINAVRILNSHLAEHKDIMDAKEELMNAGLKQYAKL